MPVRTWKLRTARRRTLRADLARDPILATGAWLVAAGMRTPDELVDDYRERRERVFELAEEAARHPQLGSAEEVMLPLAPRSPASVAAAVGGGARRPVRR